MISQLLIRSNLIFQLDSLFVYGVRPSIGVLDGRCFNIGTPQKYPFLVHKEIYGCESHSLWMVMLKNQLVFLFVCLFIQVEILFLIPFVEVESTSNFMWLNIQLRQDFGISICHLPFFVLSAGNHLMRRLSLLEFRLKSIIQSTSEIMHGSSGDKKFLVTWQ